MLRFAVFYASFVLEEERMRLKLSQTAVIMMAAIAGLFGALLPCGLAVIWLVYRFEPPLAFGTGLFAGCALSALKVFLMERALSRALDMEKGKAKGYASLQALLRYGLTIAALVCGGLCARRWPQAIGLFGIIAGTLTLQLSSYITSLVLKKKEKKEKAGRG